MTSSDIDTTVRSIRDASRRLVRELGFMKPTLAGTDLAPSAVHALIEIDRNTSLTASALCEILNLEKSSVSRMVRKLVEAGELTEGAVDGDGRAKSLMLTGQGRETVARIDTFARSQVNDALVRLKPRDHGTLLEGLEKYADALHGCRTGAVKSEFPQVTVAPGYQPGIIGRSTEMHASYYARAVGFGAYFESKVASGLSEFAGRLDRPVNDIWAAVENGRIIGTIAIDGEDLGAGIAHLRWFIIDDGRRGGGIGRRLLNEAVSFCDRSGFAETQLWTFRGLDAARKLYETFGFTLVEEQPGTQWGEEVTEQRFVRKAGAGA